MVEGKLSLADADDMHIPHCVDTVEDAIAILRESQAQWQKSTN
jgi:hypothetical protein